jgi:hypothetical protein
MSAADYSLNAHSFLAGPRVVSRREDGLTAFFHILVGATRVGLTLSPAALVEGSPVPLLGRDGSHHRVQHREEIIGCPLTPQALKDDAARLSA